MFYIYSILCIFITLVAYRCLRTKYDGVVPVFTISFVISGVLTVIISNIMFFTGDKVTKTVRESYKCKTEKTNLIVLNNDNDKYVISEIKNRYDYKANPNTKVDVYVNEHTYFKNNFLSSHSIILSPTTKGTDKISFLLSKKNYEVLESN